MILEVVNEWYINGLSPDEVRAAGRLIREGGYSGVLAGSTPADPSVEPDGGRADDARAFAGEPFNLVTLHTRRDHGYGGWEHVKEERDAIAATSKLGRPIVLGEPMGFATKIRPGVYDQSADRALAAMLVAWVAGAAGYCYHADGGLWSRLETEPGEDRMRLFWSLPVPRSSRGWRFINGHWPDAPINSATGFEGETTFQRGPYRIYGAKETSGVRFFGIVFGGRKPWTLTAQRPIRLVRYDEAGRPIDAEPLALEPGDTITEGRRELLILTGDVQDWRTGVRRQKVEETFPSSLPVTEGGFVLPIDNC